MNAHEWVAAIRRSWVSLISFALIGALIGLIAYAATPQRYTSTTQAFVALGEAANVTDLQQGGNYAQQIVSSYADLAESPLVLEAVRRSLDLDDPTSQLEQYVNASVPVQTVIIQVSVTTESPVKSARIANELPKQLGKVVRSLSTSPDGAAVVQLTQISSALPSTSPSSPGPIATTGLALAASLLISLILVFARERLDTRIRSIEELSQLEQAPILGRTVYSSKTADEPVYVVTEPTSMSSEAIRTIRTNLQYLEPLGQSKVFAVSSCLPGEGKTTTSINLAQSIAESGKTVLLIDADLRRPNIARLTGLLNDMGLTDVLIGRASATTVLQDWGEAGLKVLPSGDVPPNPNELLLSHAFTDLLKRCREEYSTVIIDCPPILAVSDAASIATRSDGVIMVVEFSKVRIQQLNAGVRAFDQVGAVVRGFIESKAKVRPSSKYGYGYGYGYGYRNNSTSSN